MTPNDGPIIQINDVVGDSDDVPLDVFDYATKLCNYLNLSRPNIEITLLPESQIKTLNNQYFSVDEPTDTITFNLTPESSITGDIYLCPSIIKKIQLNLIPEVMWQSSKLY